MYGITNPKGMQEPGATTTAGGENKEDARNRHRIEAILWIMGLIVQVASCFIFHVHHQPFPIDIAVTQTLTQLQNVHWVSTILQVYLVVILKGCLSCTFLLCCFVGLLNGWLTVVPESKQRNLHEEAGTPASQVAQHRRARKQTEKSVLATAIGEQ